MSLVIANDALRSWTEHVIDRLVLNGAKARPVCVFIYMRRLLESLPKDVAELLQEQLFIDERSLASCPNALFHPEDCICRFSRPEPDELAALYWETIIFWPRYK